MSGFDHWCFYLVLPPGCIQNKPKFSQVTLALITYIVVHLLTYLCYDSLIITNVITIFAIMWSQQSSDSLIHLSSSIPHDVLLVCLNHYLSFGFHVSAKCCPRRNPRSTLWYEKRCATSKKKSSRNSPSFTEQQDLIDRLLYIGGSDQPFGCKEDSTYNQTATKRVPFQPKGLHPIQVPPNHWRLLRTSSVHYIFESISSNIEKKGGGSPNPPPPWFILALCQADQKVERCTWNDVKSTAWLI